MLFCKFFPNISELFSIVFSYDMIELLLVYSIFHNVFLHTLSCIFCINVICSIDCSI